MPSGVGLSMSAPAATSDRTQRVQPERAAYTSAVNPPTGRYCARGSEVICESQSFAEARAFTSAPLSTKNCVSSGKLPSTAQISAVWSLQASLALTSAPRSTRSLAISSAPTRAASINAVWSSPFGESTSAPASSSCATSSKSPSFTASASGDEPYRFVTSALTPDLISSATSSRSTL